MSKLDLKCICGHDKYYHGHYLDNNKGRCKKKDCQCKKFKPIAKNETLLVIRDERNQSPENPYTTAEGVKTGMSSRITPKVVPEKDVNQSRDALRGCGKMYCSIDDCGKIDDTYTAYCIEHGRSHHRICGIKRLCPECKSKEKRDIQSQETQEILNNPKVMNNINKHKARKSNYSNYIPLDKLKVQSPESPREQCVSSNGVTMQVHRDIQIKSQDETATGYALKSKSNKRDGNPDVPRDIFDCTDLENDILNYEDKNQLSSTATSSEIYIWWVKFVQDERQHLKILVEKDWIQKAEVKKVLDEIYNLRELPAYDYDDSIKDVNGKQIRSRTYKDIHYGKVIDVIFKELKKRLFG